jgi:hypothetical protein
MKQRSFLENIIIEQTMYGQPGAKAPGPSYFEGTTLESTFDGRCLMTQQNYDKLELYYKIWQDLDVRECTPQVCDDGEAPPYAPAFTCDSCNHKSFCPPAIVHH